MARHFDVPAFYRSSIVSTVKEARRILDPRKKDLTPSLLDFGSIRFRLARHFGFCYGVENAIEIAYRALEENPDKRIYLLSEMIHNPHVNEDLQSRGIRFLRTTHGTQLIPFSELAPNDVVIIPAFGTTTEIQEELAAIGLDVATYNTTCPFVEKVWKHSHRIGNRKYTVVIHGKRYHEETQATFSHARQTAPVVVVRDLEEAERLADIIRGTVPHHQFYDLFSDRYSAGFDVIVDLAQIGVVNQTTMLATETTEIADCLRQAMVDRFGIEHIDEHYADTSDTLCYATNENQDATRALVDSAGDLAVIIGGTNSSNTSHLVELCSEKIPTYFISEAEQIKDLHTIEHFDLHTRTTTVTNNWMPEYRPVDILLTAGASCPDVLLDDVIRKIIAFIPDTCSVEAAISCFQSGSVIGEGEDKMNA